MTLPARGVLWLFSTTAVPAGAVHLTRTALRRRWQMAFSRGHALPRRFGVRRAAAPPSPRRGNQPGLAARCRAAHGKTRKCSRGASWCTHWHQQEGGVMLGSGGDPQAHLIPFTPLGTSPVCGCMGDRHPLPTLPLSFCACAPCNHAPRLPVAFQQMLNPVCCQLKVSLAGQGVAASFARAHLHPH